MAKAKRYDEGGVTEGQNSGIDDDTRARAMKFVQSQSDSAETEESTPAAKTATKTKTESKQAKKVSVDDEAGKSRGRPAEGEPKTTMGATRTRTSEEVKAAIPTGGKKGAGPTPGNGNSVDSTETSRNLKNIASALTPLGGGVGKIGAELALSGRAAKAAEAAAEAKKTADAASKATRAARVAKTAPRAEREAKTLNPNAWMAGPKGMKENFKSGGGVKGWGIARGSRAAKTY